MQAYSNLWYNMQMNHLKISKYIRFFHCHSICILQGAPSVTQSLNQTSERVTLCNNLGRFRIRGHSSNRILSPARKLGWTYNNTVPLPFLGRIGMTRFTNTFLWSFWVGELLVACCFIKLIQIIPNFIEEQSAPWEAGMRQLSVFISATSSQSVGLHLSWKGAMRASHRIRNLISSAFGIAHLLIVYLH